MRVLKLGKISHIPMQPPINNPLPYDGGSLSGRDFTQDHPIAAANIPVREGRSMLLLSWFFLLELCIALMAVAIYVKGERPLTVFLSTLPGMLLVVGSTVSMVVGVFIVHCYVVSLRARSRDFRLVLTMNVVMAVIVLTTAEIAVRAGTISSTEGEIWRWRVLVPKNWAKIARYENELLDHQGRRLSYLVYDDLMGWTVGPNRRSANGLYYSSSEGIRAPHEGISFAKATGKTRIALVGDSFTFGEDVMYEQSWGYLLEKALGPEFEVLNFGVGGYGVDQAYLRYEKDVRQWKPKLVIFGLIADDVERSMRLYHALSSGWLDFPFSKPRFVLRGGDLQTLNVPPLRPHDLFSQRSISELPFLEYDRGYKPSQWQIGVMHHSYLARAVMTLFPRWELRANDVSDSAVVSVNASVLNAFIRSAFSERTIPVVLYFPEKAEFIGTDSKSQLAKMVLREAGMAYTDLTSCLMPLRPEERFVSTGYHYSPQGNSKVAECMTKVVNEALAVRVQVRNP
jgi:hypothetical protein